MGQNYNNPTDQVGFRVLFFENISKDEAGLLATYPENEMEHTPIRGDASYAIEFHPQKQYMSQNDYRFNDLAISKDNKDNDDFYENYGELIDKNGGHRIGGYPYFTQTDPREYKEELREYELLFQLDTE